MQLAVSRFFFVVWLIWNLMATSTGKHHWTRLENEELSSCYYSSQPSVRGYRKCLYDIWHQRNGSNAIYSTFNEQKLCGQAQSLLKRKYFTDVELRLLESRIMDNMRATSAMVEPPSLLESTNDEVTSALYSENPLEPAAAPEIFQMVLTEYQCNLASTVASYMNENCERPYLPPLQGRFLPNLKEIVANMNTVLSTVNTSSLFELCNLYYCAARVVSEECGVKHNPTSNSSPPPWKTRILSKLKRLKLDQSRL